MPAAKIFKKPHCNLAGKHQENSFSQELKKHSSDSWHWEDCHGLLSPFGLASFACHQQCDQILDSIHLLKKAFCSKAWKKVWLYSGVYGVQTSNMSILFWLVHVSGTVPRLVPAPASKNTPDDCLKATFGLKTASQFPKSHQNPYVWSLTPIHPIIKSSFLTLTKNNYFQQMIGVQDSIPTPFSEEKIAQIMQIFKFSHGLTHPCNKHLEFEAQNLRHHDHHAVFIGCILQSWH